MLIPSASCRRRFPTWGMSWVRRRWPWGLREPGQHRWFVHETDFSKSFQTVLSQNVFIIWYNVWWSGENRQKYRSKLGFLFIFDFDTLTLRKHKYSEFNQNDMEFLFSLLFNIVLALPAHAGASLTNTVCQLKDI